MVKLFDEDRGSVQIDDSCLNKNGALFSVENIPVEIIPYMGLELLVNVFFYKNKSTKNCLFAVKRNDRKKDPQRHTDDEEHQKQEQMTKVQITGNNIRYSHLTTETAFLLFNTMEEQTIQITSYEKALNAMDICPWQLPRDMFAPSVNQFRLRPSEEAAIAIQKYLNPPPPWGIKINLSRSFLGAEKCLRLGQKLILSKCVTYLDISMCDLEEKFAKDFFFCVERNSVLLHLNVNGNAVKDAGACAAAKCIGRLETLHIASNEITDVGAIAFADAIRVSGTIKTLNIRSNNISVYGLYKIMDALEPVFDQMPIEVQELVTQKEGPKRETLQEENPTSNNASASEEVKGDDAKEKEITTPAATEQEGSADTNGDTVDDLVLTGLNDIEDVEEEEEIPYNENLHTLWVDYNDPFPQEMLKTLNLILAKRFPQPPPVAQHCSGNPLFDAAKLRLGVSSLFSGECDQLLDQVFDRKHSVSEQVWTFGPGAKASLYLVNKVPLFVEVNRFTVDPNNSSEETEMNIIFPTVFFFLRFRELVQFQCETDPEKPTGAALAATLLFCRGATSRFIISGAHLMIPGIVAARLHPDKRLALIFSMGNTIPYAIGYVSQALVEENKNGIGAFVLNCFKDNMWNTFVTDYNKNWALSSSMSASLPPEFTDKEVTEIINDAPIEDANVAVQEVAQEDPEKESYAFSIEDRIKFCLIETIKMVTAPIPLSQFMALFAVNYPRDTDTAKPIDFKETPYKKALTYLHSLDWIAMEEPHAGVHVIAKISHRVGAIRDHDLAYGPFLETVHLPRIEAERIKMQQEAIESDKVAYEQKILSVNVLYAPRYDLDRSLASVLLLGIVPEDTRFPELGEDPVKAAPECCTNAELQVAMNQLYGAKHIINNINKYIREKNLIVTSAEPRSMPTVRVNEVLAALQAGVPAIPVNQIGERCLERFTKVNQIILQTSIKGLTSSSIIPPKQITVKGRQPVITLSVVTKRGRKMVTIVVGAQEVGFDLHLLCLEWKALYSTSCNIVDPNDKPSRSKYPLEIHLQGTFTNELRDHLTSNLGVPIFSLRKLSLLSPAPSSASIAPPSAPIELLLESYFLPNLAVSISFFGDGKMNEEIERKQERGRTPHGSFPHIPRRFGSLEKKLHAADVTGHLTALYKFLRCEAHPSLSWVKQLSSGYVLPSS
eukprot:gene10207-7151_t